MADSLFAHLALTFGSQPENLATEALAFILQKSGDARRAVAELLATCGAHLPADLSYATQVSGADAARPDLVARDDTGEEPLLVEVKFWAGLTDNQPVAYLNRLKPGHTLLVVVPDTRSTLVWGELRRRCVDAKLAFAERSGSAAGALTADVAERNLVLLSWRSLLRTIHRGVDAGGDRKTAEDVAQLDGLCERMDQEAFLPLSSQELTSGIYRRVLQFNSLVDDVVTKLVDVGVADTKGARAGAGAGYYARYLRLFGVGVVLSCDIRKWMKLAPTPVWLAVLGPNWSQSNPADSHRVLAAFAAAQPGRVFKAADGFPCVAISIPTGVERHAVLAALLEQMTELGRLVAPLASASVGGAAPPPPADAG